jgi:hypothetical protein
MSDQPHQPEFGALLAKWVADYLGFAEPIIPASAVGLLTALVTIWWNWEKVQKLPGVAWLLQQWRSTPAPTPLPTPTPGRFSVAVAHLENDQNGEQERILIEALAETRAVQVLRFDRIIDTQDDNLDEAARKGHQQARELLGESGADVLIWGTVLRSADINIPKLRWTTARALPLEQHSRRYPPTSELDLPEVFQNDLTDLLDLLVLTTRDYISPAETYTRGPLPAFIERVHKLLTTHAGSWPRPTAVKLLFAFGDLCLVYGTQNWREDKILKIAQESYRAGLPKDRDDYLSPRHAEALFNCAKAHFHRGVCLPDTDQLAQAIPLYEAAAYLSSGGRDDWLYMMAKLDLGHVLPHLEKTTPTPKS